MPDFQGSFSWTSVSKTQRKKWLENIVHMRWCFFTSSSEGLYYLVSPRANYLTEDPVRPCRLKPKGLFCHYFWLTKMPRVEVKSSLKQKSTDIRCAGSVMFIVEFMLHPLLLNSHSSQNVLFQNLEQLKRPEDSRRSGRVEKLRVCASQQWVPNCWV